MKRPLLLVSATLALAGCFNPFVCSPMGCAKAVDGRARLQPVIDAVVAYGDAQGAYPDSVAQLVPAFLPALPDTPDWVARSGPSEWWYYERSGDEATFSVGFAYGGPGMNHCGWTSDRGDWRCSGHY